ncbi:MAG: hypothetical protein GYA24_19955 [Candidatus Lokiarchaeota archaeon]|nr:hypothetical protein [Candidatus Lokiarchaeota archaeon]
MNMIIAFWIALGGITGAICVVLAATIKSLRKARWGIVATETMARRGLAIDAPGGSFKAYLYTSSDFDGAGAMPGMILLPDCGKKFPAFEHWAAIFALQGLPTLAIEIETGAKGIPGKDLVEGLVQAFPSFKKALIEHTEVDPGKIGVFAFGTPALAGLYAGAADGDVKAICCGGMPRFDDNRAKDANKKVFLVHCKDDEVAPLADFMSNKQALDLGNQDYLLLDRGGHEFISQEAVIAGFLSIKANRALQPRYKQFTPTGVVVP